RARDRHAQLPAFPALARRGLRSAARRARRGLAARRRALHGTADLRSADGSRGLDRRVADRLRRVRVVVSADRSRLLDARPESPADAFVRDRDFRRAFARIGLPVTLVPGTETTTFALTYRGDDREMTVERLGDAWHPQDVAAVPRAAWVHVAPLLRGDFPAEMLAALARGRRLSFDGQ